MTLTTEDEFVRLALHAASEVARRLGGESGAPIFLCRSQHISVLLPSMGMVARILVDVEGDATVSLDRELAVARYLTQKGALIA